MDKWREFLRAVKERDEEKSHPVLTFFAFIGVIAAIGGVAYALYRYFAPKYLGEYSDDDFEDDFDDYFEDEEGVTFGSDGPEAPKEEKEDDAAEEEAEEAEEK